MEGSKDNSLVTVGCIISNYYHCFFQIKFEISGVFVFVCCWPDVSVVITGSKITSYTCYNVHVHMIWLVS